MPAGPRRFPLPASASRSRAAATALALVLAFAAPVVPGRRARADDATYRNLVQRAVEALRDAERLDQAGRPAAQERARRARVLLAQADTQREREPEVALFAVQASVFEGNRPEARAWLDRYAARTPYGDRDPKLPFLRALVAWRLDHRPDLAIEELDRMHALAPKARDRAADLLAYTVLLAEGGRRLGARDCERALGFFRRAVAVAGTLGDVARQRVARANAGIALQQCGRPEDAIDTFRRLQKEDPESPLWSWYLALSLANQERFEEAAPAYQRVIAMLEGGKVAATYVPLLRQAYLRLGNTLRQLAKAAGGSAPRRDLLGRARKRLEHYVELEPRSVAGRYWLGVLLYEEFGRPYDAMAQFEKAHALDPVCDGSLGYLVRIADRHGPPPGTGEEDRAAREAAWRARLAAWKADLEEHAAARAAARTKRRQTSPDHTDGCR